jgi:hypothetical protein
MKKRRLEKMVIDFLRVNETATTSQIYDYIKSQIRSTRSGDCTKQELGNNLRKWCVKTDNIVEENETTQTKRKVVLWKLRDEYEL